MKKQRSKGVTILGWYLLIIFTTFHLLISGCTTTARLKIVDHFIKTTNEDKIDCKIAYQDDWVALPFEVTHLDLNKKVNICISDIYFKEKKVIKPSEEYNWYVYPRWSPDGSKLAFVGITCKSLKEPCVYDVGVFVCDENSENIKKLYSSVDVSNPFYTFFKSHLIWTYDNEKIGFPLPTNSERYKWILVSIGEGEIVEYDSYDKMKRTLYSKKVKLEDDFLPFIRKSPDGKWEIHQLREKTILLNPRDWFFRKDFYGSIEANPTFPYIKLESITYIARSESGASKRTIWASNGCHTQWTPDSKYVVGYDFYSDKAFIANLEGEVVIFKGENTHVQYRLK